MRETQSKSTIVGLKELRNNLETYVKLISKGQSFTVMRRSQSIFKIVPPDEEEKWETLIDFTSIDKNGMLAEDVLKVLKNSNG